MNGKKYNFTWGSVLNKKLSREKKLENKIILILKGIDLSNLEYKNFRNILLENEKRKKIQRKMFKFIPEYNVLSNDNFDNLRFMNSVFYKKIISLNKKNILTIPHMKKCNIYGLTVKMFCFRLEFGNNIQSNRLGDLYELDSHLEGGGNINEYILQLQRDGMLEEDGLNGAIQNSPEYYPGMPHEEFRTMNCILNSNNPAVYGNKIQYNNHISEEVLLLWQDAIKKNKDIFNSLSDNQIKYFKLEEFKIKSEEDLYASTSEITLSKLELNNSYAENIIIESDETIQDFLFNNGLPALVLELITSFM